MITANREDYLRAIFQLIEQNSDETKSIDVVKFLEVSKPSVSEMLKKLQKIKLITIDQYFNITLTNEGLKIAKKITYKHRIAEVFLKEILKLRGKNLHKEAHKLEHSMSDEVAKKIAKLLKNPKFCPCGHKIPNI